MFLKASKLRSMVPVAEHGLSNRVLPDIGVGTFRILGGGGKV